MNVYLKYYPSFYVTLGERPSNAWMFTVEFDNYRHHSTSFVKPTKKQRRKIIQQACITVRELRAYE